MTQTTSGVVVPSSPSDLKRIKKSLKDASDVMTMIKAKQDTLKDIKSNIKEEFDIPAKMVGKLISTYHNQNYGEVQQEAEDFELFYERVVAQKDD